MMLVAITVIFVAFLLSTALATRMGFDKATLGKGNGALLSALKNALIFLVMIPVAGLLAPFFLIALFSMLANRFFPPVIVGLAGAFLPTPRKKTKSRHEWSRIKHKDVSLRHWNVSRKSNNYGDDDPL